MRGSEGMRVGLISLVACGLFAVAARAQAPIIEVEKDADRRIAIGIGKYSELPRGEIGSPPGDVVAFDLELSGWFEAKKAGMLEPRTLNDWARLGAEVLVEMNQRNGDLLGAVRDVGTGDILFESEYPAGRGTSFRDRIHEFSNDIVSRLAGETGLGLTKILCEWDPGDGKRIVRMDVDGFGLRELTGDDALELTPRWSADGKRATYTSYSSGFPDLYVHDLVLGTRERVAGYEGLNAHGQLAPDGRTLVMVLSYAGDPDIYTKDLETGTILRLTRNPATDSSPVWSPDGERIAFVSDRSGAPQIWVMNASGGAPERLTVRGSYNTAPDWSPDGTRIAYSALRSDGFQIQYVDLETRRVTTVTELGGCEDPCWSPDGRSIVYSRKAGDRTDLYVTNLNERRALRITRGSGRYSSPDWSRVVN